MALVGRAHHAHTRVMAANTLVPERRRQHFSRDDRARPDAETVRIGMAGLARARRELAQRHMEFGPDRRVESR